VNSGKNDEATEQCHDKKECSSSRSAFMDCVDWIWH
jgi:hypothetical protein